MTSLKCYKKLSFGLLCLCAPLLFAATSEQCMNETIDMSKILPPGQMIDVGGYKLHLYSIGKGGPAVIIDSGLGGLSSDWGLVQTEIAKFTQVVTYDRAGLAWSESSPYPRTSKQIIQELHTLLKNAKIPKPYILVGHSFGGNNIQLYAATYPDEVLGLVLVDSCHVDQVKKLPPYTLNYFMELRQTPQDISFKETYGLSCFMTEMYLTASMTKLPVKMQKTHEALFLTKKHCRTVTEESNLLPESLQQLANTDRSSIRNMPCFVLSAGRELDLSIFGATEEQQIALQGQQVAWKKAWDVLQNDIASKFNGSHHLIAKKSGHMIPWDQPELIVHAVRELVEERQP